MPSLYPGPGFEYYYKACKKGDSEAKAVTVDHSSVAALANASKITGLPRDNFEIREISKEEFERLRTRSLAIKEEVGIHLLLTRYLFACGIPHRLLRRVSLRKPTSAPLRF